MPPLGEGFPMVLVPLAHGVGTLECPANGAGVASSGVGVRSWPLTMGQEVPAVPGCCAVTEGVDGGVADPDKSICAMI